MGLSRGTVSGFLLKNPVIITNLIPACAQCTTATSYTHPGQEQVHHMTSNMYLIQSPLNATPSQMK